MFRLVFILTVLVVSFPDRAFADGFPTFTAVTLDPQIGKVCYAVTLADVDADGRDDIVAVTEDRVLWFQAPDWKPRTVIDNQTPKDNVCIAAHDIDGDGQVDFALGAGWTKRGTIHWLSRGKNLDDPWNVHFIGEELWLHRMRFADVLGTGTPQLVISPLNASEGDGVRLLALEIPADPVSDRWMPSVLNASLNRMHNHWHDDMNHDGLIDTLTASREGVHLIHRTGVSEAAEFSATKLGDGNVDDQPNQSGSGEVKLGKLGDGTRFIVTVEPMHGHTVAGYLQNAQGQWDRQVIDDGFQRGHALWTADVDGDGSDEIAFGHSDTPETFGVILYDPQVTDTGVSWTKHVIDSGDMACEDLVVADLTGDGKPDIVAGGRATGNLKLYIQD